MSASESDLQIKIGATSTLKNDLTPAAQAVTDLRTHVGTELNSITALSNRTFTDLADHLNLFVRERIPVGGGLFVNLTEGLKQFIEPAKQAEGSVLALDAALRKIQSTAGTVIQPFGAGGTAELFKFSPQQINNFLVPFAQLETQAQRDAQAVAFFGQETAEKLMPQLQSASAELLTLNANSAAAASGLGGVGIAAAVGIGAIIVVALAANLAIAEMVKTTSREAAELEHLTEETGLNIKTITSLGLAFAESGRPVEGLTMAVRMFVNLVDQAGKSGGASAAALKKFGLEPQDAVNDLDAALAKVFKKIAEAKPGFEQISLASEAFGRRLGSQIIPVIMSFHGNLSALVQRATELGVTMDDLQLHKLVAAEKAISALSYELTGLTRTVAAEAAPAITEFIKGLSDLFVRNRESLVAWSATLISAAKYLSIAAVAAGALGVALIVMNTSAISSSISGFVSLIGSVRLLGQVMIGTASLVQGAAATATAATLGWAAVALAIGAVVYALTNQSTAADVANKITEDSITAQQKAFDSAVQMKASVNDVSFALSTGVEALLHSTEAHEKLNVVIGNLDPTTRAYIEALIGEKDQVKALTDEINKNLEARKGTLQATLVSLASGILDQQNQIAAYQKEIAGIQERIRREEARLNQLQQSGQGGSNVAEALRAGIRNLSSDIVEFQGKADALNTALVANEAKLQQSTQAIGVNRDQLLSLLRTSGLTADEVKRLGDVYDSLTPKIEKAAAAARTEIKTLQDLRKEIEGLGEADAETKRKIAEEERQTAEKDAKRQLDDSIARANEQFQTGQINRQKKTDLDKKAFDTELKNFRESNKQAIQAEIDKANTIVEIGDARTKKLEESNLAILKLQQDLKDKESEISRKKKAADTAALVEDVKDKTEALKTIETASIESADRIYNTKKALSGTEALDRAGLLAAEKQHTADIFAARENLLTLEIGIANQTVDARQKLERDLKALRDKRQTEVEAEAAQETKVTQESRSDQDAIAEDKAKSELAIVQIKNKTILAEAKALTQGLSVQASEQLRVEIGLLAASSDARIKAIDEQIKDQEKQRQLITASGKRPGASSVENQVAQEQVVNDELARLIAQRNSLYTQDVNAASAAHLSHEKLAQLETKLAIDEKNKEIAIAEQGQKDLESKGLSPADLLRQQKDFDNKIEQLKEQRRSIESEANAKAAEGRKEDLADLAKYEDNYAKLVYAGLVLDEEISRLHIRLLVATHAGRFAIIEAQFKEEKDADDKHHAQELRRLKDEYDAAIKSAKTMQDKLAALKKYHADVDKENKRQDLSDEERAKRQKREEMLAGPGGGFLGGLQSGQLKQLEDGVKSFADVSSVALSGLGAVVNGLGQGVGQMVQNWVLMGTLGPDAVRKMVASVLAGVAQQAAVQAIYELAQGFAYLFIDPVEAGAHFTAAGLFGSIAGVAAVAGRAVAGNAFQSQSAGGGAGAGSSGGGSGSSGGGSSSGSSSQNSPIVMGSQRGPDVLHLQVTHTFKDTGAVHSYVESAVVKSASGNGAVRQVIVKEVNRQG